MNVTFGITFTIILISFVFTIFKDISISTILNLDALMIVIGGTLISLLVGFPMKRISDTINDVINSFSGKKEKDTLFKDIIDISRIYGKTSIKTVEARMGEINDNFLKLGLNLLINGHNKKELSDIMKREVMIRTMHYNFSQNLLNTAARLTPSFGMAGTVLSLIKMFGHFESIEAIVPLITIALTSTLYGVVIANIIIVPLSAKLKDKTILSETTMQITIEGILAIHSMEDTLKVEDRMNGYRVRGDAANEKETIIMPHENALSVS